MRTRFVSVPVLLLLLSFGGTKALSAQIPELLGPVTTKNEPPARVPFGPGEHLVYKLKLGIFSVGEGHMEVVGLDSVRGQLTYHTSLRMAGGIIGFRVRSDFQSWFTVQDLVSLRFVKNQREGTYRAYRHYEFINDEMRFERADNGEGKPMPTNEPLDDVSFLYFARSLPLKVGDEYSFDRYFKETGNPVVIRVLGIEEVEVPAGRFETVVVQPIIQTDGMFADGGEAKLYFTNDDRRLLVQMKSSVPVVGSLTLQLKSFTEGHPLRPTNGTAPVDPATGGNGAPSEPAGPSSSGDPAGSP